MVKLELHAIKDLFETDQVSHDRYLLCSIDVVILIVRELLVFLFLRISFTLFNTGQNRQECPLEVLSKHVCDDRFTSRFGATGVLASTSTAMVM